MYECAWQEFSGWLYLAVVPLKNRSTFVPIFWCSTDATDQYFALGVIF